MTLGVTPAEFRNVLGHFPTGVVVVTAIGSAGAAVGLSVGSFTSVSLDPPLVAFLPAKSSTSWPRMSAAGSFCVNVLSHPQEQLSRRFSRSGGDKFAGLDWTRSPSGNPILPSVIAWIDCRLDRIDDAGDHWIVLGEVTALSADSEAGAPLVFYRGRYGHFGSPTGDAGRPGVSDATGPG